MLHSWSHSFTATVAKFRLRGITTNSGNRLYNVSRSFSTPCSRLYTSSRPSLLSSISKSNLKPNLLSRLSLLHSSLSSLPTEIPASTTNLNSFSTMSALDVREIKLPLANSLANDSGGGKITLEFQEAIDACSTCLLNGGVISVPTDTIYGIAGLSQKTNAVNRIYDIKQRNYQNPVAISVGHVDDIYRWSKVTVPRELLTDLLPGPVTVVFDRSPELNPSLNPHTSKVGIRIPGNTFMQELAKKCAGPIALTSANISGGRSCLQIEEFQHLWPQLDLVVNGGVLNDTEESRLGSTVVDLSEEGTFRIIRNGSAHIQTVKVLQDKYNLTNISSSVPPQAPR